jgi:hypothetical protein
MLIWRQSLSSLVRARSRPFFLDSSSPETLFAQNRRYAVGPPPRKFKKFKAENSREEDVIKKLQNKLSRRERKLAEKRGQKMPTGRRVAHVLPTPGKDSFIKENEDEWKGEDWGEDSKSMITLHLFLI